MKRAVAVALSCLLAAACTEEKKPEDSNRFQVKRVNESTFEVVPNPAQKPYCLAFTTSEKGVVRQLTMTHENKSMKCDPGQPIAGLRFRAPADEGTVKVHVFFSSEKLSAASLGQQIYDLVEAGRSVSVLDLRLPGQVDAQTLEFVPEKEHPTETGVILGAGGTTDGGAAMNAAATADAGGMMNAGNGSMPDAGTR
ncbi:MAG: hypothetical protein ACJ790_08235 [Myxococcaceae bacterium]